MHISKFLMYSVEQKILLSSVTHVLSGLMGYALAVQISLQKEGGKIEKCRNVFAQPCTVF